jgi:hypothetical protein
LAGSVALAGLLEGFLFCIALLFLNFNLFRFLEGHIAAIFYEGWAFNLFAFKEFGDS